MTDLLTEHVGRPALVVFEDEAVIGWLRVLKPGFRHCFAAINDGRAWVEVLPLARQTLVRACVAADRDLAVWYRSQGNAVVETMVQKPPDRLAPPMLYSCVEETKRLLGIHARWVITPYQLYRHLRDERLDAYAYDPSSPQDIGEKIKNTPYVEKSLADNAGNRVYFST